MSVTAGVKLRQARERRSLSLEQVAQATRIRTHYIQAIEAGELEKLPSMAQARGFLRAYASYLGLDGEALLAESSPPTTSAEETTQAPASKAEPHAAPAQEEAKNEVRALETPTLAPQTASIPKPVSSAWEAAQPAFTEIGLQLKRQRETLGLSLEDVERHTHLRHHYLQALEDGNIENMPSPVQGRGMLNNYAAFLGMDPEPLLLRFADGLQSRLKISRAAQQSAVSKVANPAGQRTPRPPSRLRRLFSSDVLIGSLLVIFLVAFIGWSAIRVFAIRSDQEPTATAPSIADILLASPTPSLTPTPLPATPTSPLPPGLQSGAGNGSEAGGPLPNAPSGKVQIYISVRQRAWMRVTVDGEIEFEGRVIPDSAYTFVGDGQIEVLTGNGAALQIFLLQRDLGLLGSFGQVVNHIYTLQGVLDPTPTITPTGTATSPVTDTPAPTLQPGQTLEPSLP